MEKDADAGYVIFELASEGKTFSGTLELVRVRDAEGRPATRVIVAVANRPAYTEQGLLDRLGRKLREELGDPAPPPAPPSPPPEPKAREER